MMPPTRVYSPRQMVDELWNVMGQAMTSESVCVCVCFFKVWPCYNDPFRNYAPLCYRPLPLPRPLFQLACTVNQPSFGLSTKSCASLWIHLEVMHLLQYAIPTAMPPFSWLAWTQHHPRAHTHLTSMPNFSLLGRNCGHQRGENFCGPTDWLRIV